MNVVPKSLPQYQHWVPYQKQITKYLEALEMNPFFDELRSEFDGQKTDMIVRHFSEDYADWLRSEIHSDRLDLSWMDRMLSRFPNDECHQSFVESLESRVNKGDLDQLLRQTSTEALDQFYQTQCNPSQLSEYTPTALKFVTTTAVSYMDNCSIDFRYLFDHYDPPASIVKEEKDQVTTYMPEVIGQVIGCKYGNLPVKGYFKRDNLGDFYNCATLNVCIDTAKTANVKVFNNGMLQLTGIPSPEDGKKAVRIVEDCLRIIASKPLTTASGLSPTPEKLAVTRYQTVMINTCYQLNFKVNREILYDILVHRYKLMTIYDAEGYPGVRIHYFYHKSTIFTKREGICCCDPSCDGKGSGEVGDKCRKLSIAIFQSGSTIIAGGCETVDPVFRAYDFLNAMFQAIMPEIRKGSPPVTKRTRVKKERPCDVSFQIQLQIE